MESFDITSKHEISPKYESLVIPKTIVAYFLVYLEARVSLPNGCHVRRSLQLPLLYFIDFHKFAFDSQS
jgi:hypothetical protein